MVRRLSDEQRLRNRVRDLERRVDSWHVAADEPAVWDYLEQLNTIAHLAHHGIRRPDDLGGSINGSHPSSKPPAYNVEAMAQLKTELAHLRQRADTLRREANHCDGASKNGKSG